jgi:methionyl-tRNA synthetase
LVGLPAALDNGCMVCPLCEHAQVQGDSCDECGMRLAPEAPAAIQVEELPELEATRVAPSGEVPIVPLVRLDRGREENAARAFPQRADTHLSDEEDIARCPSCGLPGRFGHRCNACGVPLTRAEA